VHTGLWWGNLSERDRLKDTSLDGRIILKGIFRMWDGGGGMDWIDLAENRDRWQELLNEAMNFWAP